MKISEFIKRLERVKVAHGDLEVVVCNGVSRGDVLDWAFGTAIGKPEGHYYFETMSEPTSFIIWGE